MRRSFTAILLILAGAVLQPVWAADNGAIAVRGGQYVNAKGELVKDGVLLIQDSKLRQVGGEVPAGVPVYDFGADAVLSPGLIECSGALGSFGDLAEVNAVEPAARARDAFDRFHSHLPRAMRAGVTTFALSPDPGNLVGGQIAICQTSGPEGRPYLIQEAGPIALSLSPQVFRSFREPTSRAGAIAMLRDALAAAAKHPKDSPLGTALSAKGRFFVTAPAAADVASAVELLAPYGVTPVVIHTLDSQRIAADAVDAVAGVVVGPFKLDATPRAALAAARLERAGIRVAITGQLPIENENALRIGAAVAARNGMAKPAARRAITSAPAELLGISDRLGALQQGLQADVVVFSGDPLDLRSRVLAVYVGGRRVYQSAALNTEVANR